MEMYDIGEQSLISRKRVYIHSGSNGAKALTSFIECAEIRFGLLRKRKAKVDRNG